MKIPAAFIAATLIGLSTLPAQAQWHLNSTQTDLQARISAGIQSGQLTGREARQLQQQMQRLQEMENQFRASGGGLNRHERRQLQSQLNELSAQITQEMNDFDNRFANNNGNFPGGGYGNGRGWGRGRHGHGYGHGYGYGRGQGQINNMQAQLQAKINAGVASGALTRREASQLQNKLNFIAQLETRMGADGLDPSERQHLSAQLSQLSDQLNTDLTDRQRSWNGRYAAGSRNFWK